MRSLFCVFSILSLLFVTTTSPASLLQPACNVELNDAVNLFNTGNAVAAKSRLEAMLEQCDHLPQVHHNLGVIAGAQKQWSVAQAHFQRAIANDSRTSMTVAHLQNMHQYRATEAYQSALRLNSSIAEPDLQMQDATMINSAEAGNLNADTANPSFQKPPLTDQHNAPTIDYELYAWWSAAAHSDVSAWLEHYAHGYPPLENNDALEVSWTDVGRDISFTAQDAVVVLSYRAGAIDKRTLLLLRLQNNRWKIYREASL